MIGFEISEEYENQLKKSLDALKHQRLISKKKREDKLNALYEYEKDEYFSIILGYTSGGFPFGVTHQEMEEINNKTEFE